MVKILRSISSKKFFFLSFILTVFIALIFFFQTAASFIDPDLGWHLQFGKLARSQGIPLYDPFSYSMPSYKFINHEWLIDFALSVVYTNDHVFFIAVLFASLAIFSLLLQFSTQKISRWSIMLLICVAFSLRMFVGIRPQVLSWLFFSIIWYFILNGKYWLRWRAVIPFIFLVWANIHGGFPMGLALLTIYTGVGFWQAKAIRKSDIVVILCSYLATCINPYGFFLWKEIFVSIFDTSLRWSIQEWLPSFATANLILWAYVTGSATIVFFAWRKMSHRIIAVYLFFLLAALSSVRHMPFWLLISIPITTDAGLFFYEQVKKTKGGIKRLNTMYIVTFGFLCILYIVNNLINHYSVPRIDEVSFYPTNAITYIKRNLPKDNIFSFYGWGGYLIWKLPEKKVFVDGRMPSWKQASHPGESENAFKEHNEIFEGIYPVKKAIAKYHISTFLLPVEKKEKKKKLAILENYFTPKKKPFDIYEQLRRAGWKIIYKDTVAVIYQQVSRR